MADQDGRRLDLRSLLAAVETAPPVAAVDVIEVWPTRDGMAGVAGRVRRCCRTLRSKPT